MLFNIYSSALRNKTTTKAIWHFTIYQNNKRKIYEDSKFIQTSGYELFAVPVCSALLYIIENNMITSDDIVNVMTRDSLIFNLINFKKDINKFPLFKKYYQKDFKKNIKNLNAIMIPNFYTHFMLDYKKNTSYIYYERELKILDKYQMLIN